MAELHEVYKKSGLPSYTFVEPAEFNRVLVTLQTPGRCMVVEGPSGIGKTSCVRKALDASQISYKFLSARKQHDVTEIKALLATTNFGNVVIDDFHRLPSRIKNQLADLVKTLADEEDASRKIVLIGINRAGQALIEYAPDVLHRVEVVRFGRTSEELIKLMIGRGETVLNCDFSIADEIAEEAQGSFAMAQILCHEACLACGLIATHKSEGKFKIEVSLPRVRENVLADLGARFHAIARDFATGNKLRREGRAPYLHLLKWLSVTSDGVLDVKEAMTANPTLKGSVSQVIDKGHLQTLIEGNNTISELVHFEVKGGLLTIEDPKFLYFIRNLIWSKFAKQVGYYSLDFRGSYDFALSFAGEERVVAHTIAERLVANEAAVFYDKNEQHRILANDVEEYLAPIYRSESRFVVALLSENYPKKIWTKFESDNFKERFGSDSIIPIWFRDSAPGIFDISRSVGGMSFDPDQPHDSQVEAIVQMLCKKLEEDRQDQQSKAPSEGDA